jgi:hypothetical protein
MTNDKEQNTQEPAGFKFNRRQRRNMERTNKRKKMTRLVSEDTKHHYTDDSYKDKTKKVFSSGMSYVKERLAAARAKFDKPERVPTERKDLLTTCMIINRDGRVREFLPDVKPQHKILVHRNIAKVLVSGCCMLVRITKNEDADGHYIDGSWAITPAEYRMMQATTIQMLRKRKWWWLHRYWYEIDFDGRVQPAHLLFDYQLNPISEKTRLWITREYVPVADTDEFNDYFRFWKTKPKK